ncbi:HD domain-containing protein, partial [Jimgerdemannia flammicorona]
MSTPSSIVNFLHIIENLKHIKRTGWINHNIKNPESIADHIYRMAVMAMLINDKNINTSKCVKMAIIHDLAECIIGDITPHDNINIHDKHLLE